MLMLEFELWISGVKSDSFTNWATTTVPLPSKVRKASRITAFVLESKPSAFFLNFKDLF